MLQLHIVKYYDAEDYSARKHIRITVVDLDKAKSYPLNFVCLLPLHFGVAGSKPNSFVKLFGERSLELARKLLVDALKVEQDADVRGELERRLKLLDVKPANPARKMYGREE